jgi:hypothetical protein
MAFPVGPLSGATVPEGTFLVDAVTASLRRARDRERASPWWNMPERILWVIDLLGRLEQRENART